MSKKIIIPLCRNPFDIYVNHHFYSYPAGEEVEVPDEVAEVIEQHIGCHVTDSAPPASGGGGSNNFSEFFEGKTTDLYCDDITTFNALGCATKFNELFKTYKLTSARLPKFNSTVGEFSNCSDLVSIDMHEITQILAAGTFQNCSKLKTVNMPKIEVISSTAFQNCVSLESFTFPYKILKVSSKAFGGCEGLKSVTFKGTPMMIGSTAFSGCTNLKDIYVPWAEGAVANNPWGAENATIHYNTPINN